jgi:hypothetical protein
MVHAAASGGPFVQWVVHLPARGTMFVAMQPNPAPGRPRSGTLSAGTREFASLHGTVSEAFVRDGDGTETEGHIELRAALVGLQDDQP